jgi:hypothetical protein
MKFLARVGGGEGRGTKVVDKIGAPISLLSVAFFVFLRLGFLAEIFGSKKSGGELTCWTPYCNVITVNTVQYITVVYSTDVSRQ